MATCRTCGKSFRGDEDYCPEHEEFEHQRKREEFGMFCTHCKQTMLPGEFERHRWRVYYRTRDFPMGQRIRL